MKKWVGTLIGIVGLLFMLLGVDYIKLSFGFLKGINTNNFVAIGIVLVVASVFLLLSKGKKKKIEQESEEVPIYRGNKIVGYRRQAK